MGIGETRKNLLFVWKVLEHVKLYWERERGGGEREMAEDRRITTSMTFRSTIIGGGAVLYLESPRPNFQVLSAVQSYGARPQAPGRLVRQSQGQTARHWLKLARGGLPEKVQRR